MMCKLVNCNRKAEKRKMCQMHYRRWWRAKNPTKNKEIQKRSDDKNKEKNGHWSKKKKVCQICNIEFTKVGPNQKYCSKRCQSVYKNKQEIKNYDPVKKQQYYIKNKKEINKNKTIYKRNKIASDNIYKLKNNLRSRFNKAIKNNYKSGSAVNDLGCSIEELKVHLEANFYPDFLSMTAMNWDNYGLHGWHIDHIIPLSKFDLTNPEELKQACHYTNLQPLWAKDNLSKGSRHA